jgi:type II secretory pathway predicted ATPase ExeA/DNA repair exonuclease SbcCD ATPase subunit
LVSGDARVGKTSLARAFLKNQEECPHAVLITMPGDGGLNLLRELCKRFSAALPECGDADMLMRELSRELQRRAGHAQPLLFVDQLERLSDDSAPSLLAVAKGVAGGHLPLSLVLVASPVRLIDAVNLEEHEIHSCITAQHSLGPFGLDETREYIRALVASAGGTVESFFATDIIEELHRRSRGVPGELNGLCDWAMRAAHRAGDRRVRLSHVEAAAAKQSFVEKSVVRSEVLPARSTEPGKTSEVEVGSSWPSASLVDTGNGIDFDQPERGEPMASTPIHGGLSEVQDGQSSWDTAVARVDLDGWSDCPPERRVNEIEQALDDLQRRAAGLDSQAQRISILLDTLDEKTHRAEAAAARSSDAELRLRTIAADVAAHAEALQERTRGLLEVADSTQDVEESLQQLGAEAQALATAARRTLSEAGSDWQRTIEHSGRQAANLVAEKSATLQAQMDEAALLINERGPKFIRAAEHQLQDAVREVVAGLTPVKSEMRGLLAESAAAIATIREHTDTEHERSLRRIEQMQAQTSDALIAISAAREKAQACAENLDSAARAAGVPIAQAVELASQLGREGASARVALAELTKTVAAARNTGDTLISLDAAMDDKMRQLASHEAAARCLLNQLTDAAVAAADAGKRLDEQLHATRDESNRAADRWGELSTSIERSVSSAEDERKRLESQVAPAAKIAADLQQIVALGIEARAQIQAATDGAMRQAARLHEHVDNAERLAVRSAELQNSLGAANEVSRTIGVSIAEAVELASQLNGDNADAKAAVVELTKAAAAARNTGDTLVSLDAAVDARMQQLASHEAAGRSLLNQLTDAAVAAADAGKLLDERLHAAKNESSQVSDRWSELSTRIEGLISSATEERERLEGQVVPAANATADLEQIVALGIEARAQIHAATEAAMRQTARLREQSAEAEPLATLSTELQNNLAKASEISPQLEETIQRAKNSVAEIDIAVQAARTQVDGLAELHARDAASIESHRNIVLDTEALLDHAASRLESLRQADRRIETCSAASDELLVRLAALHQQLADVQAAVAHPQRVLADAQSYAAQLEQVCEAVRKVKTGVSQAALAAGERTRELTAAEREASQQLQHLRQEISAAAQTLAQWVQEADRAQARLESTIQTCPPIRETHAASSLKGLAQAAGDLIERAQSRGRPIQTSSEPSRPVAAQSQSREEEIAELLAEARKARKEVAGLTPGIPERQSPESIPTPTRTLPTSG